VRATAERERTVILAEAQRDAQRVRGDGDAQAVKIYADASAAISSFFAFYRSLQAYRNALNGPRHLVRAPSPTSPSSASFNSLPERPRRRGWPPHRNWSITARR